MIIYTDPADFKCHTKNPDGVFREYNVPFFDGKCQTFVEGYRYCPAGESYTRGDGEIFYGECIVPWKPFAELDRAQREYERQRLAEYTEYLKILGVEV